MAELYSSASFYVTVDQRIQLIRNGGAKWIRKQIAYHYAHHPEIWIQYVNPDIHKLVQACVRLTDLQREQMKTLGGSSWLRAVLQDSLNTYIHGDPNDFRI
jgi:hypothetical protein